MVDANVNKKRRQECRRGTQECVRHNDFNSLRFFAENYMTLGETACATMHINSLRRGWDDLTARFSSWRL